MSNDGLLDSLVSEFEEEEAEEKKLANQSGDLKEKLSALEARRAVEELLELKHYVDDVYDEVY